MERGTQLRLLAAEEVEVRPRFPSTRYQGSKAKLIAWIIEQLSTLSFDRCLDAFGGTGVVAYHLKLAGKEVTYNDILRFNYLFGLALVENANVRLSAEEIEWLLQPHDEMSYPDFIERTFPGIYFTDAENRWLDQTLTNIRALPNRYKQALAFFALAQAALAKRPYNLFHRRNLYLRQADVSRSFGNKATWDKPFPLLFRRFAEEANRAVFDNGRNNRAMNCDVLEITGEYDLVYLDPPYISRKGVGVDYRDFYHFLEGMTMYERWGEEIDYTSRHLRLRRKPSPWHQPKRIQQVLGETIDHFRHSILAISYRSDGIPSPQEIERLLGRHKARVRIARYGRYRYVLSTNRRAEELLFIAE